MHELSIVMSIIGIAEKEASRAQASHIEEIELDIGALSGVEMASFDFAWTQATRNTILEKAERKINNIPGNATCSDCDSSFSIEHYYDPCPNCGSHLLAIKSGKELKVRSLVIT